MKKIRYLATLMLAFGLLLAACGDDDAGSAEADPMRVAYAGDLDPNDIADQFGIDSSGAQLTHLTENSGVVAGLNNNQFDIGNIDVTDAIKAIQAGVPLTIVYVSQNVPEFVMVSQSDITDLDGLAGRSFAYHSPGSLTEIMPRELIREHDPTLEDKVEWVVLPESPNRAAAMIANRIDATALEFLDVETLQAEGDFNIIGNWGDLTGASADAMATVWVTTDSFLAENRDRVVEFLGQLQAGYDRAYSDKDAWLAIAEYRLPEADPVTLALAYDYYTGVEMYPQSGESPLTEARWSAMDQFFRQIGEYEQEAPLDIVDIDLATEVAGG